jgi:hypothetical protein
LSGWSREAGKLDQARLVLVELRAEPGQPVPEVRYHPPCIRLALEAHAEVAGVANDRDPTARMTPSPL